MTCYFVASLLLLASSVAAQSLPNLTLTPGEARPLTLRQVCSIKWGKDVRHVTPAMKRSVCQAYSAQQCPGPAWEIDHLIPRSLAGADSVKNLWPQPIAEAHKKDRLETNLHKLVCVVPQKKQLPDSQACVDKNWIACYKQVYGVAP